MTSFMLPVLQQQQQQQLLSMLLAWCWRYSMNEQRLLYWCVGETIYTVLPAGRPAILDLASGPQFAKTIFPLLLSCRCHLGCWVFFLHSPAVCTTFHQLVVTCGQQQLRAIWIFHAQELLCLVLVLSPFLDLHAGTLDPHFSNLCYSWTIPETTEADTHGAASRRNFITGLCA